MRCHHNSCQKLDKLNRSKLCALKNVSGEHVYKLLRMLLVAEVCCVKRHTRLVILASLYIECITCILFAVQLGRADAVYGCCCQLPMGLSDPSGCKYIYLNYCGQTRVRLTHTNCCSARTAFIIKEQSRPFSGAAAHQSPQLGVLPATLLHCREGVWIRVSRLLKAD